MIPVQCIKKNTAFKFVHKGTVMRKLKVRNLWIQNDGNYHVDVTDELKALNGSLLTAAEYNLLDNMWASVTTTFVDGTDGTGTVQFVFKDAAGVTMATPVAGMFYLSEVATGLASAPADTSIVTLTNGEIQNVDAAVHNGWRFITSAAGLLGATITAAADSYWIVFIHPTGKLVISDEMAITGP
jgi:hypothetical protein